MSKDSIECSKQCMATAFDVVDDLLSVYRDNEPVEGDVEALETVKEILATLYSHYPD